MEDPGQEDDHEMRRESAPSCHRSFRRRTRLFRNGPDGAVERIHGTKGDGGGGSSPGSVMTLSWAIFKFDGLSGESEDNDLLQNFPFRLSAWG